MEQLLKALHLTETAARLKGFTYRAGQKMRKYLKQIFRDIGIAEKKPRWTDMRLNYQLTQRTKHSISFAAFLLSSFIDCDYGIWGVALISLLYLAKSIKISAVIMAVLLVPYYGQHIYSNVVSFEAIRNMCFSLLSILFVCLYNGQHGSKKKWIYYWAYPLHILFFAILRCYPFF